MLAVFVAYTIGYRTRLAQVLAFVSITSLDARNLLICPDARADEGAGLLALLGQAMRRRSDGPLSEALAAAAGPHTLVAGVDLAAVSGGIPADALTSALEAATREKQDEMIALLVAAGAKPKEK